MGKNKKPRQLSLSEKYPASAPCSCEVCLRYCQRPGWWTVAEAEQAMAAGLANRMMLEMAPDRSFAVLSPAFKGNEGKFALNCFAALGCTFLQNSRCELHATGYQPLECRFCHHDRVGSGPKCHTDIEQDWRTARGRELVVRWGEQTGFWEQQVFSGLNR